MDKMKELIIDLQITRPEHTPLSISGCTVERWNNTSGGVEWSQQRVYFLRKLKQTSLSTSILLTFYKGIVASVLSYCMSTWYFSCSMTDKKTRREDSKMEWEKQRGSLVCLCSRFLPESLQKWASEHCQAPLTPRNRARNTVYSNLQKSCIFEPCPCLYICVALYPSHTAI